MPSSTAKRKAVKTRAAKAKPKPAQRRPRPAAASPTTNVRVVVNLSDIQRPKRRHRSVTPVRPGQRPTPYRYQPAPTT